jgi:type IV pilus assembly protein PilY1
MRKSRCLPFVALFGAFLLLLLGGAHDCAQSIDAYTAYWACRVPSVAGVTAKPNVFIVMDYSGSMQFGAYWQSDRSSQNSTTAAYDDYSGNDSNIRQDTPTTSPSTVGPWSYKAATTYFGLFLSDTYYTYDKTNNHFVASSTQPNVEPLNVTPLTVTKTEADPNAPPPAVTWTIQSSASDGGIPAAVVFTTTAPHGLKVGYEVTFSGLTAHTGLNGAIYTVVATTSTTFKVLYPWMGTSDTAGGCRHPGSIIVTINSHPFKKYTITSTAGTSPTGGTPPTPTRSIWLTAPGHTFTAGQQVTLQGLTKHYEINGFTFTVKQVNGNDFRIDYPFRINAGGSPAGAPANYPDRSGATASELVAFSGMSSHTPMNGQAYEVRQIVDANRIRVNYPFNGKTDDPKTALGQRRIAGTISTDLAQASGVSGNLLNFVAMSRIDAAERAFTGGRAECDYIPCMKGCDLTQCKSSCTAAACAAMTTAIGSKTTYYCFLKGLSGRRYLRDNLAVLADFYVRPIDSIPTSTPSSFPNNWDSGNTQLGKTTAITVLGQYWGELKAQGTPITTGSPIFDSRYFDQWKIVLTQSTAVVLHVVNKFVGSARLSIHTTQLPDGGAIGTYPALATPGIVNAAPAKVPANLNSGTTPVVLAAGTYYVRVSHNDSTKRTGGYQLWSNVPLIPITTKNTTGTAYYHNMGGGSDVGTIPWAQVRVKVPTAQRQGVLQTAFSSVRFGFMYFNSNKPGQILHGCHDTKPSDQNSPTTGLCHLLDQFSTIYPTSSTPTGEAMNEAMAYFKQSGMNTRNTSGSYDFLDKGSACVAPALCGEKDPFYQAYYDANGVLTQVKAAYCRNSFLLLVSDGQWNGTIDPADPAHKMRTTDLRPDATEPAMQDAQTVKTYSIFAFGQGGTAGNQGVSAMKTVAMFGSYRDASSSCSNPLYRPNCTTPSENCTTNPGAGCGAASAGFPYPRTSVPATSSTDPNSLDLFNPDWTAGNRTEYLPGCDPTPGKTYCACCHDEWDLQWDEALTGDNLNKGIPDTFFNASDGTKFQQALMAVIQQATASNASGGAVSTQSQTGAGLGGDIVVHALCEAAKPGSVDTYLWYGHLEGFWPFYDPGAKKYIYEFDPESANKDLPCYQITSLTKRCWDGASILSKSTKDERYIFTAVWDESAKKWTKLKLPTKTTVGVQGLTEDRSSSDPLKCSSEACLWGRRLGLYGTTCDGSIDYSTWDVGEFIDWLRGQKVTGLRERTSSTDSALQAVLGDVIYSTPVTVGRPAVGAVSTADTWRDEFYAYRNKESVLHRDNVAYVGANDGMLHAFLVRHWQSGSPGQWISVSDGTNDIGKELWAYIPSSLLTELKYLAVAAGTPYAGPNGCVHRTMVDLAPAPFEARIKVGACENPTDPPGVVCDDGRCWRTLILGGLRGGGDTYFALDVTDPYAPLSDSETGHPLWEYSVLKNKIMFGRTANSLSTCAACTTNCNSKCAPDNFTTAYPFLKWYGTAAVEPNADDPEPSPLVAGQPRRDTMYYKIKGLPASWTMPVLGQLELSGLSIPVGMPLNGGSSVSSVGKFDFEGNTRRSVAFIGGGLRNFDDDCRVWRYPDCIDDPSHDINQLPLSPDRRFELFRPDLLVIDLETGTNLFKYIWPQIDRFYWNGGSTGTPNAANPFPVQKSGEKYVPYSLGQTTALDLLRYSEDTSTTPATKTVVLGDDGLTDYVYVGDITGRLWSIKFNLWTGLTNTKGIEVDLWKTRNQTANTDYFRTTRQPITVSPSVSFEGSSDPANPTGSNVLVVFGTGKYDDTDDSFAPGHNDKSDTLKMSLYNLRDAVKLPSFSGSENGDKVLLNGFTGLYLNVNVKCPLETFSTSACTWSKASGSPVTYGPDSCGTQCWNCVFDFAEPVGLPDQPGERIIGHALIASGYVWVTTFVPSQDICNVSGNGYLYIFKYNCMQFLKTEQPLALGSAYVAPVTTYTTGSGADQRVAAYRGTLGEGRPSEPVLDSEGKNVLIQGGEGKIIKIPISNPPQAKAWRER